MRSTIKLNEKELNKLIMESVKRVLNEYGNEDSFFDYGEFNSLISKYGWAYGDCYDIQDKDGNNYVNFRLEKDSSKASDIETLKKIIIRKYPGSVFRHGQHRYAPELKLISVAIPV